MTTDANNDGAASTISTRVEHLVGFHFSAISHLRLSRPLHCEALRLRYTFTPDFIVDPYELDLHEDAYAYELHPHPDLELPVFAASSASTVLTLLISRQTFDRGQRLLDIILPLHARYGKPSYLLNNDEAYEVLRFPQPGATWQCTSPSGTRYEEQFWLNATTPEVAVLVPVGMSHDAEFVELGTVAIVYCTFAYLIWVFTATARHLARQERRDKNE
ncbi:hypothetical protein BC835DRAFT_1415627 [Cytidiella melzeri]|nr:hypothetical protein BC835DRAFT_1415627 [Cytidiella melzeri]